MGTRRCVIVSHDSALEFWRAARVAGAREAAAATEPDGELFGGRALTGAELARRAVVACGLEEPLHLLSVAGAGRVNSARVVNHLCSARPAESLLFDAAPGVRVCRMPLVLVQLARSLDVVELARIAYEMTGTYGVNPASGEVRDAAPLHALQELRGQATLARATGVPGASRACDALGLVVPNANSVREADVALMLMLSRARGGFHLPGFELNPTIELPKELWRVVGSATLKPDFYWDSARMIVEYESDDWHATPEAMHRDERRRRAFEAAGFVHQRLTNDILKSDTQLNIFMAELVREIDPYRRRASASMLKRRSDLRELLFGPQDVEEALKDLANPYEGVIF